MCRPSRAIAKSEALGLGEVFVQRVNAVGRAELFAQWVS